MFTLPPTTSIENIETRAVLKKLSTTRAALAELKGVAATIPNEQILIDTLSLQEAKESSAIENIVTTHDEIYQNSFYQKKFSSAEAKEVYAYAEALKAGFEAVKKYNLITVNSILNIQQIIVKNNAGLRKLPGTALKNETTGEVVYTPPQHVDEIEELLDNLVWFINTQDAYNTDPLIKMAIIHHQFESIHPFYDGNGRTGRIINLLFLIQNHLLSLPVLYLSRYIINNRQQYYQLLQSTRDTGNWEPWILYMLEAVEKTSIKTIAVIKGIKQLMLDYKKLIRTEYPKIYSQYLLNCLFRHPYTKINFLEKDLNVTRVTATKYLENLVSLGILEKKKIGRSNYYLNKALFQLLSGE